MKNRVIEFKYPGFIISSDGDTIHNISTWVNAVWASFAICLKLKV